MRRSCTLLQYRVVLFHKLLEENLRPPHDLERESPAHTLLHLPRLAHPTQTRHCAAGGRDWGGALVGEGVAKVRKVTVTQDGGPGRADLFGQVEWRDVLEHLLVGGEEAGFVRGAGKRGRGWIAKNLGGVRYRYVFGQRIAMGHMVRQGDAVLRMEGWWGVKGGAGGGGAAAVVCALKVRWG